MKNRKLLLIASLVLALTMSLGGTLAYLTDMDEEVNTFTLGEVDIEIKEDNFKQNDPLWPGEQSDKDAYIENKGQTDAWVWMTVTIPANIKDYVFPVWANDTIADSVTVDEDENGNKVYTYLVPTMLNAGQTTDKILEAVEMSNLVDVQNDQMVVVENGQPVVIEGVDLAKLDVTVKAYAVQAKGIESVGDAYKAYHDQWDNGDGGSSGEDEQPGEDDEPTVTWTEVGSLEQLQNAVAAGGNIRLTADIPTDTSISILEDTTVVLDLNGKQLSVNTMDYVIRNKGTLTITGGTVQGVEGRYAIYNEGTLTVDGAIVKGVNSSLYGCTAIQNASSVVTIQGNSEIVGTVINTNNKGSITITGGTFSFDPSDYVDPDQYDVTNANGTWTVTAK